jgi:hypothetical protein
MPAKKTTSVNEQILVEAARIYDARNEDGAEGKVIHHSFSDVTFL